MDLRLGGIVTKADTNRSAVQRSGAFMGKGCAVKSRTDGDSLLSEGICQFLAVPTSYTERKHPCLLSLRCRTECLNPFDSGQSFFFRNNEVLISEQAEINKQLKEKQAHLESDEYYEEIARENLGLLKSTETLYINADNK